MNTMEAIFSRKCVRSFTAAPTEEELSAVLKAAYAAPVGRAMYENVHLTVITNKDLLNKIDANGAAFFGNPAMHPLYNAPVFILVSARLSGPGGAERTSAALETRPSTLGDSKSKGERTLEQAEDR